MSLQTQSAVAFIDQRIKRIDADLWRISYILESETQSGYKEIINIMKCYGFKYENRIGITVDFEKYLFNLRNKLQNDLEAKRL